MTAPFPHQYEVSLAWNGQGGAELTSEGRPPIEGGAPPQFDGREHWWSPEHLLLSSVSLCLMTTFQAISAKARLELAGYRCRGRAVLDRTATGFGFTLLTLTVEVTVTRPEDVEQTRRLLAKAKSHCMVANALRPPLYLDVSVAVAEPVAVA